MFEIFGILCKEKSSSEHWDRTKYVTQNAIDENYHQIYIMTSQSDNLWKSI